MSLENISSRYEKPIIGVIGATSPLPDYDSDDAYRLGYELRELVTKKGTLFTGGVHGVGIDVYRGIVDYSIEKGIGDKFFVLVPNGFQPPQDYIRMAGKTKNGVLRVETAGKDMEERRTYLADISNLVVVVNGAKGTIDEALKCLSRGKQIICLENSGGAADVMSRFKRGEIGKKLILNRELVKPFYSITELIEYLSNELDNFEGARR